MCWFRVSLLQINQLNQNRVALEAEQVFNNQDMISKFAPMRNIPRAFRLVWNSSPKWTALSIFIALLMSAFPLIGLYAQGHIMDELVALLRSPNSKWDSLKFWVILVAGIGLFGSVLKSILTLVSDRQSQDFTDAMKDVVYQKSSEVDLSFYEDSKYQDTMRRAQAEAPVRPNKIVGSLVQLLQGLFSLSMVGGVLILNLHWGILILLGLAVLPGLLLRLKFSHKLYDWQRKYTSMEREVQYFDVVLTDTWYAKELRLFNLAPLMMLGSRERRRKLRKERFKLLVGQCGNDLFGQFCSGIAGTAAMGYIVYAAVQGHLTIGQVTIYLGAFQRGQGALSEVLGSMAGLYENNLFLNNLFEFLDLKPSIKDKPGAIPVPKQLRQGIVFENVSFTYPGKDVAVLKNLNMVFRPGQAVALVGENGSGKTTLVKLLCRLYEPTSGRILLEGRDIREYQIESLRAAFSVIFQDYVRYNQTVAANIGFGNVECFNDRDKIVAAAKYSGADEVIDRLPNKYDSMLGRLFEGGEELSVGQWQKVALARAFLRESPFIILDEPTSALDARAEFEVFERFVQLAKGRASIMISHRLSTTKLADTIYMLDHGQLVEEGSHDELIMANGQYANIFNLQALRYRE